MSMQIEITDNSGLVKEELQAAALRALEKCGLTAEGCAKLLCPVDTGNLRNSITHQMDEGGDAVNGFFYWDGEERGLLAKKRSQYGQWMNSLTPDEKDWILDYTAGGYGDINDYSRRRGAWEEINAEKVQNAAQYLGLV